MHSILKRCVAVLIIATAVISTAWGQAYPSKPVKLIVPYPAGGSADTLARLIGQKLSEIWGQPVVVDNKPGANGIIGTDLAAKSLPDGYTLYVGTDGPISINPSLYANMPYDWKKDFVPVSLMAVLNQILVVHPSLPATSVQELVALAKSKPGQLNYASMGRGSSPHLGAELFKSVAGVDITHVPYKGSAQSITGLLAGEVSLFFVGISTAAPFVKAGRLRALAVTSKKRSDALADVPTFVESGLPDVELGIWFGLFAPAGTPPAVISRLNTDIAKVLDLAEVRQALASRGFEPRGSSPEEFRELIQKDQNRWAALIRQLGIKPE